jgi:hypothetical protein
VVLAIKKPANCWQKTLIQIRKKNSLNFWSQKFGSFKAKTISFGAMLNKMCLYASNFGKFNSLG